MKQLRIEDIDLEGVKAVVFDLDGTLYDKHHLAWYLIFADLRHALWIHAERIARKKLKGQDFGDADTFYKTMFSYISEKRNVPYQAVKEWYNESYMPSMTEILYTHYQAADYVLPLLKQLNESGIKTIVLSDYGCVEDKIRAIGLEPKMFDYCVSAPELGGLKPNKQLYERLLKLMRVKPKEAMMIGDRMDTDGEGAEAAGMRYMII